MHRGLWKATACIMFGMVLATGCSDGDSDEASTATTSQATIAQPTTSLRPIDTSFTGQGSAEFCGLAKTFKDRFANVGTPTTPAALRSSMGDARAAIAEAVAAAPAEIKADMQILSTSVGEFFTSLDRVNFDANRLDPNSLKTLQAPEFVTASQRLEAYLRNVCRTG